MWTILRASERPYYTQQKASASHELVEIEEKSEHADKKIEELTDPEHNKKYYEQEKNYGGEKDYIF